MGEMMGFKEWRERRAQEKEIKKQGGTVTREGNLLQKTGKFFLGEKSYKDAEGNPIPGPDGRRPGTEAIAHVQQTDPHYGTADEKEGAPQNGEAAPQQAREPAMQGGAAPEGEPYNELRVAFVDALTRGHSRTEKDRSNELFDYVTTAEFINERIKRGTPTPLETEGFNDYYKEDMAKTRKYLAEKLEKKDITNITFPEMDILFVALLSDTTGSEERKPGVDVFIEFMHDVAKRSKNLDQVGAFIGNTLAKLTQTRSTSDELHQRTEHEKLGTIMSPIIAQEYFEENSYPAIEQAVNEFESRLPEKVAPREYEFNANDLSPEDLEEYESLDEKGKKEFESIFEKQVRSALNESMKRRLVDSFRQTLLSDPLVIEDVSELEKRMPATYEKDIGEKVKSVQQLITDIAELKASGLVKQRIDKRFEKLKKEISEADDLDENIKETLTGKLEELEELYADKIEKIKNFKEARMGTASLPQELGEDDKKKIEKFNNALMELEEVNSDIVILVREVDEETKKDDEVIKIAKDVVKKLKESVTEDGITKDQFIIASIIYEGGKLESINETVVDLEHPMWNPLLKLFDMAAGVMVLEPATEEDLVDVRQEQKRVPKGLKSLKCHLKNITFLALSPSVLRAWSNKGGRTERVFKKALYYTAWPFQATFAGVYGLACAVGATAKWIVWDSYSNRKVKKAWPLRFFGIGTAKAIYELGSDRETMMNKSKEGEWKPWARKGYLAAGLAAIAFAGITTLAALPNRLLRESIPSFAYPNFKASPISVGKWYVDINPAAFNIHERKIESKREMAEISILGDIYGDGKTKVNKKDMKDIDSKDYLNATKDKRYILQLYYPGVTRENLKAKEKEYKEQLEWIQNHQEVADFLAERTFGIKLIDYAIDGEKLGKEKRHFYDENGRGQSIVAVEFGKGKVKDSLRLNPNMTPEFIAELMALEQGIELVNSKVGKELKTLHEDYGTYREMSAEHGENKVKDAIDGHIIGLIEKALSGEKEEKKEARGKLDEYGIGFDDDGELTINDGEKLRAAVIANVVEKIEENGIEYFNDEMKVAKAEMDHRYLKDNLRNWENKEYVVPKVILGYMNTYGITSVENAGFLMANPDVQEWLGRTTTKGYAVIYVPGKNVEEVVGMFREEAKKATDGVGVVTVLSDSKRLSITGKIESKALEKELAVDTSDEYRIHKTNERIAAELGEDLYPETPELRNYLRRNEVKDDWFSYLYGEKTYRDKTEIRNELLRYLEGQKKKLASTRAKRIEEDLTAIKQQMKDLQNQYDLLAETEDQKNNIGLELMELGEKKEYLEQEKEDPEAYLNQIIAYIKHGVKEEETEGIMTEEAQALLAMEREARKAQAIEYLENARKEKDIKHMLSTYRAENSSVMVIEGQLDDFIRYVMKHIENGGRASDFEAYGKTEMNRRYLDHAMQEGYLQKRYIEMETVDDSGVAVKTKINQKALDMCDSVTMHLNNVFEHMPETKEYQSALEKEGSVGLKNIARAFIYKKMEQSLENNKTKNELIANGIRFNGKTGKAEIADAKKVADYIYEGKIKEVGQTSVISAELVENSKKLLAEIDEMTANDIKHIMKKKKYTEEQVITAVHGYVLTELAMVQSGDVVTQEKLESNGIEFSEDGMPQMTDKKKVGKYLMNEVYKPMKQFGIENIENKTEKMKNGLEVESGEVMGEDVMGTPEDTKEEKALEGLDYSNGVQTFVDKDDPSKIYVKFTKDGDYRDLYMTPREAIEEVRKNKKIKKVEKGPMLVNKEGKPVYKFEVMYDAGIMSKEKPATAYVPNKGIVKIEQ